MSNWCVCTLTTSFQRPLHAFLLLGCPIFHQNWGTSSRSDYIKARIVDKFCSLSMFLRNHQ